MARKAFYSFHYNPDSWRASLVRNMGIIEGNIPVSDNDWEEITLWGEKAIKEWIDRQLYGKSVAIVLIGAKTAGRKWIKYEIKKAWNDKKGVLGIYIHNLEDKNGGQSPKGSNPLEIFTLDGTSMSEIIKAYDPPYTVSSDVYNYIKENLADWIEGAIDIRAKFDDD
jgi:hypothetical protein